MAFKGLKKFSDTKQHETVETVVLPGQISVDDYMRQTFGSEAVPSSELPTDKASLSVIFDYDVNEVH